MVGCVAPAVTNLYEVNEINKDMLGNVTDKLTKLEESHITPSTSQASQIIPTEESDEVNKLARPTCETSADASDTAVQSKLEHNKRESPEQLGFCGVHLKLGCRSPL